MDVKAKPEATQRTKSRVSLLTHRHDIVQWSTSCSALGGASAALFRSPDTKSWFGWLPWHEIRVDGVEFGDAF